MDAKRLAWTAAVALVVVIAVQHYQAKAGGASMSRLKAA